MTFRHSGWQHDRTKLRQALIDANASPRAVARFDLCGSEPWVRVNAADPTDFSIVANHCHSRWCVPCARSRATRIAHHLKTQLRAGGKRLLTLTLRQNDKLLSDQLDRLYACFRTLRKSPAWKAHVDGGAAVLEVKHAWHSNRWHPHLHIVYDGRYFPQRQLSAEWKRITHDSFIVDVRYLPNTDRVAQYVTKYLVKPYNRTVVNRPDALCELVRALRSRRLVLTFGSWRGLALTKPIDHKVWTTLCPLDVLYERASSGDPDAKLTLHHLLRCVPDALTMIRGIPPPVERP